MSSGWESGCSSWRMDCWWNCLDFINGCGEETWYDSLSLFPISLCRCDSYYGKLLFSFGGYSLALYTVHNTVIHLVCKNKLCMWELSILDMVTLRDFSDLNFKICRILPCSIYLGVLISVHRFHYLVHQLTFPSLSEF